MKRTVHGNPRSIVALLATVLLVAGLVAAPAVAGPASDRLASVVPTEIDGQPVTVDPLDAADWIERDLGSQGTEPAVAAVLATIEAAGGDEAFAAIDLYAQRGDDEYVAGEGLALDGMSGPELLTLLEPALLLAWDGATPTQEDVAGIPVRALRYDPADSSAPPDAVLFASDGVVWYAWGGGPLFEAGVSALAGVGAAPEPSPTPPPATALEAILRDAEAGVLDPVTALHYRYLAAFGEPGLPDPYAALPPAEEDATLIAELTAAAPNLPPDVLELVAPVIVRPDDPRSVLSGDPVPQALALTGTGEEVGPRLAQSACRASGWTSVPSTSIPVRVWSRCEPGEPGEVGVAQTLAMIEAMWGPMTTIMGTPIPDAGGKAEGGDPSIDVYLVSGCAPAVVRIMCIDGDDLAVTRPSPPYSGGPAGTASAYVVLDQATMASGSAVARAQVAHELMHVLQLSHAFNARLHGATWHWFGEASAVWAEHHFVPESRRIRADRWLEAFQNRPFGLTSPTGADPYTAWTWPLFMEQEAGTAAIGAAWAAMEGATDWERLDQAIDSAVPYGGRFKDFAVRAWNQVLPRTSGGEAITPRFQQLDTGLPPTPPGPGRWSRTDVGAAKDADPPIMFEERIPALGIRYRELTLTPEVRRLVVDGSGLRNGDDLDIEALVHVKDTGWERRSLDDGETTFCRDLPPDDLDRIILVLANHHPRREVAGTMEVRALASPCDLWDATMTGVVRWDQFGLRGEARATFTGRWQPVDDGITYCSDGCVAYVPVGTVEWTWTSSRKDSPCSATTRGSLPAGDVIVTTDQMLFLQPVDGGVRFWGRGTIFGDPQPCLGWEGLPRAESFFGISMPDDPLAPVTEGPQPARPNCSSDTFSFPAGADVVEGRCWGYDSPGYEDWVEWRLVKVGSDSAPD